MRNLSLLDSTCLFCRIAAGEAEAVRVWEEETCLAFLDHRPLFAGHVLVVPRPHWETLSDLPQSALGPFFLAVRLMSAAVEKAMGADGSFVAMNNRVSQSVPHLHAHVVPRRKGDGLRGFFWPRNPYAGPGEMADAARRIHAAALEILESGGLG